MRPPDEISREVRERASLAGRRSRSLEHEAADAIDQLAAERDATAEKHALVIHDLLEFARDVTLVSAAEAIRKAHAILEEAQ